MIKSMYCVYDNRAQVYHSPFSSISHAVALRDFKRVINETGNEIHDSPEDFDLFLVATFDDQTGQVTPIHPEFLQNAAFLRKFDSE